MLERWPRSADELSETSEAISDNLGDMSITINCGEFAFDSATKITDDRVEGKDA